MSTEKVIELLSSSHSVFHVVENMAKELAKAGFEEFLPSEHVTFKSGGKYFMRRDGAVVAFAIPKLLKPGFSIVATHNDSPAFAVKPQPIMPRGLAVALNTEPYGGGIYYSWIDRPLSFAGRIFVKVGDKAEERLVDIDEDLLVIPSLAIHQNRDVNSGHEFNAAKDMVPLFLADNPGNDFHEYLARKLGIKEPILGHDLSLYVRECPRLIGEKKDFVLSPRLDDLACSYSNLLAFIKAAGEKKEGTIPFFISFDNEEVGSRTFAGADSDLLETSLSRILAKLGVSEDERALFLANSIMLSADNAHANHPNFPEMADPTTKVALNGGIVLKYNADQKYTTNGRSAAYVKDLASKLNQPIQEFTNRSDLRGGSTLGNIANAHVSLLTADIGIAQLAMHSAVELCGVEDIKRMVDLLEAHYKAN